MYTAVAGNLHGQVSTQASVIVKSKSSTSAVNFTNLFIYLQFELITISV